MSLVLKRHTCQQRVVIRSILVKLVIPHQNHLDLLHVILLVHLEGAAIDDLLEGGFVWACVVLVLIEELIDLIGELMTLLEALVVRAHKHNAHVELLKADVYVKHVLLCAARDADRRPCLAISHRAESHHEIEDHSHV